MGIIHSCKQLNFVPKKFLPVKGLNPQPANKDTTIGHLTTTPEWLKSSKECQALSHTVECPALPRIDDFQALPDVNELSSTVVRQFAVFSWTTTVNVAVQTFLNLMFLIFDAFSNEEMIFLWAAVSPFFIQSQKTAESFDWDAAAEELEC